MHNGQVGPGGSLGLQGDGGVVKEALRVGQHRRLENGGSEQGGILLGIHGDCVAERWSNVGSEVCTGAEVKG